MHGLMIRWFILLCIIASDCASNCLLAQPFFLRKDIPVGGGALALFSGDFNGDGLADLAVCTWSEGIMVSLNAGGGNFGRPIRTGVGIYVFPPPISVADFNGDGRDDILTPQGVFLSRGDGTFESVLPIGICPPSKGCTLGAAGDFNRDRKIDLVVSFANAGIRVLLGNGDGTFRSGPTITGLELRGSAVVVADFNHDGRSDVVIPNLFSGFLAVFLGNGDGTFGAEIRTDTDGLRGPPVFAVADFNGDGFPDLATPAGILLGKGDGTFLSPVPYPFEWGRASFVAAADLTGDGKADLVVDLGEVRNTLSIFAGNGDGTFRPPVEQPVGFGWHGFIAAAVDLDGDGRIDLATVNDSSNSVSVLIARAQGGPGLRRAISAASGTAIVAPQSLATLSAPTTATSSTSASAPWPSRLGGISLQVRDSTGAISLAPLLFVSPTQINFQVPGLTALGEATLAIISDGGTAQVGSMQVEAVAPALFMTGLGEAQRMPIALVQVGTKTPVPVFSCIPSASESGTSCSLIPIQLSTAGDTPVYLSFFGTGFHGANPDNVTCTDLSSGVQLPVLYAGPQRMPGVDQINIRLLPEMVNDYGFDVNIRIDGVSANAAWIDVR